MKVTGIIAEYNPFHNGHARQIQQIKEEHGSDYIVVVMSGDFVQRGECALIDKYARAKMAIINGADLVLELPAFYATASAPCFALGGVAILDALGCVDELCFGSESGDAGRFYEIASILNDEPDEYRKVLGECLKKGMSFPASRVEGLKACNIDSDILSTPNNILGIEYTKALLSINSRMNIHPIIRTGEGYHSNSLCRFASASAIRSVCRDKAGISVLKEAGAIPDTAFSILEEELQNARVLFTDSFSSILGYQLLNLLSAEELSGYYDIAPSLANRIWQNRFRYCNVDQFADLLKTKNETLLHIKRSLIHILLSIKEPDEKSIIPAYTRILAMNKGASELLKAVKMNTAIPVISKLAGSTDVIDAFYDEEKKRRLAKEQLAKTSYASNLYQMQIGRRNGESFQHENTRRFYIQ